MNCSCRLSLTLTCACPAGMWFCNHCRDGLHSVPVPQTNVLHPSPLPPPPAGPLVPTRLMRHEDCYRSLAAALGGSPFLPTAAGPVLSAAAVSYLLCMVSLLACVASCWCCVLCCTRARRIDSFRRRPNPTVVPPMAITQH